ncbi:MAG: hydroxyacid dehydrogenase [Veillonella sp.]|uniref:2-hydroxyacid dehydrogenase n=1 Tax=Veillonella sp. TaxID=1926307 RepID=UPI0025DD3D30|nr:2-hydroxyacid dehydrogenase [Veillonella sp.]MBS4914201.1 hydroxyacid dehydrogenase [Veillonella sp.]
MKIIVMEPLGVRLQKIEELAAPLKAQGHDFVYYETKETDQAALLERVKDADIIMLANQPLSGDIIRQCPNLKFISIAFTGVDHVDLAACREREIVVSNAAGYSTNAVAELAFGLAISTIRNIVPCDERCRTNGTKDGLVGFELFGKTFGVVGTGAIGRRVAEIALAFGCKVIAYNRSVKPELEAKGVTFVDKDTLFKEADFVSLHTPLTAETKGLVNDAAIRLMKPTAVLINTARGGVVDSEALANALNEGRLAAAGIDVFEMEPPIPTDHPLCHAKNCVLTPHVAFASKEALETRADIVFKNIDCYLEGAPQNLVK